MFIKILEDLTNFRPKDGKITKFRPNVSIVTSTCLCLGILYHGLSDSDSTNRLLLGGPTPVLSRT